MTDSLQTFNLLDLAQYTREGALPDGPRDLVMLFVGRDNVHEALKHVLSRVTTSLYLNMFGYDDPELNDLLMTKVIDPTILTVITLDKSQAGGPHEKALLDADRKQNLASFNTHFVIGQSATHQISHTKGFVADGLVGGEGSTNWSAGGEGTFVVKGAPGGPGYKSQNNTQTFFTATDAVARFQAQLAAEHLVAQKQAGAPP